MTEQNTAERREDVAERTYGVADIWPVRDLPPTAKALENRRIGAAMRTLLAQLIRLDVPEARLSAYADELEALAARVAAEPHLDHRQLFDRLHRGVATQEDCENIFSFEIMSGHAAAVAPPMTLWVDGEVARARANLDHVFQGPPGRVHGGVIALMMDILLARMQEVTGTLGFTGNLNIRYIAATPINTDLEMEAHLLRREDRKMFVEGRIYANGVHTVTAEGLWISASTKLF